MNSLNRININNILDIAQVYLKAALFNLYRLTGLGF